MFTPYKQNLTIYQGSTFRHTFALTADDLPLDLTNWTARMQVRESVDDATVILELTTENGGITLGGALGTLELYVSPDDTADLAITKGVYDIELIDTNDDVGRVIEGKVTVKKEVTR